MTEQVTKNMKKTADSPTSDPTKKTQTPKDIPMKTVAESGEKSDQQISQDKHSVMKETSVVKDENAKRTLNQQKLSSIGKRSGARSKRGRKSSRQATKTKSGISKRTCIILTIVVPVCLIAIVIALVFVVSSFSAENTTDPDWIKDGSVESTVSGKSARAIAAIDSEH